MTEKSRKKQTNSHRKEDRRRIKGENKLTNNILAIYLAARADLYKDVDKIYAAEDTRQQIDAISKTAANIETGMDQVYSESLTEIVDSSDESGRAGHLYPYLLAFLVFGKNLGYREPGRIVDIKDIANSMAPHKNQVTKELIAIVSEGVLDGNTKAKTKRLIADRLVRIKNGHTKGDVGNSIRIGRTEYNKYYNTGRKNGQSEIAIKGLRLQRRWDATLDQNTRPEHASADGQIADENGMFLVGGYKVDRPTNFGVASQDINCRCSVAEYYDDEQPTDNYTDTNEPGGT